MTARSVAEPPEKRPRPLMRVEEGALYPNLVIRKSNIVAQKDLRGSFVCAREEDRGYAMVPVGEGDDSGRCEAHYA